MLNKKLLKVNWEDKVMEVVDWKGMENWFEEEKNKILENIDSKEEKKEFLNDWKLEYYDIENGNGKVKEWFILDNEEVSFIEFGVE